MHDDPVSDRVAKAAASSNTFFDQVYDEMRSIAHVRMQSERIGHTLQSTELVHEAYLRLRPEAGTAWVSRGHFFAAAAEAMRRILIERARARSRVKRGGSPDGTPARKLALDIEEVAALADDRDPLAILALDRAIEQLARRDARIAQVVKLRFYAGLSLEEVADTLEISVRSVMRDWAFARAWLYGQLSSNADPAIPDPGKED